MSLIKKHKSKIQYNNFIIESFLRVTNKKKYKYYSQVVYKECGDLLFILCFKDTNGDTVNVNKELFDNMITNINSTEYKYSVDRIFDIAALTTVEMIGNELLKQFPNEKEIKFFSKGDSRLINFLMVENPTPASMIYAKCYFINNRDTDIEKFVPILNCPKFSNDFNDKTIFAVPKENMLFYGDSGIIDIKEQMTDHIRELVKDDDLLSNKFYSYDENYNIIEVGEFKI